MKKLGLLTATALVLLTSCGNPAAAPASSASYQTNTAPNAGPVDGTWKSVPKLNDDGTLVLPDSTQKAMSLTTAKVLAKTFTGSHDVPFQIFREADEKPLASLMYRSGRAYGLALLKGDVPDFKLGQSATVCSVADSARGRNAKVIAIDRLPEGSDSSWEVVLEVTDTSNQLKLAQSCTVSFYDSTTRTGLVIPKLAALKASDATYAYLQTSEGYKRVNIRIGVMTGNDIEVTEGLKAGDFVVSSPVQLVWLTELRLRSGNRE